MGQHKANNMMQVRCVSSYINSTILYSIVIPFDTASTIPHCFSDVCIVVVTPFSKVIRRAFI
ncbi:hypothetical protein ACM615_24130, partial [Rahnella sp. PAMC25617]|uniref:hypothetical protein n=1 Tax=Rahnella sp. PAMC25617 TaxID=3399684 RepID=UPI003D35FC1D